MIRGAGHEALQALLPTLPVGAKHAHVQRVVAHAGCEHTRGKPPPGSIERLDGWATSCGAVDTATRTQRADSVSSSTRWLFHSAAQVWVPWPWVARLAGITR